MGEIVRLRVRNRRHSERPALHFGEHRENVRGLKRPAPKSGVPPQDVPHSASNKAANRPGDLAPGAEVHVRRSGETTRVIEVLRGDDGAVLFVLVVPRAAQWEYPSHGQDQSQGLRRWFRPANLSRP